MMKQSLTKRTETVVESHSEEPVLRLCLRSTVGTPPITVGTVLATPRTYKWFGNVVTHRHFMVVTSVEDDGISGVDFDPHEGTEASLCARLGGTSAEPRKVDCKSFKKSFGEYDASGSFHPGKPTFHVVYRGPTTSADQEAVLQRVRDSLLVKYEYRLLEWNCQHYATAMLSGHDLALSPDRIILQEAVDKALHPTSSAVKCIEERTQPWLDYRPFVQTSGHPCIRLLKVVGNFFYFLATLICIILLLLAVMIWFAFSAFGSYLADLNGPQPPTPPAHHSHRDK